MTPEEKLLFAVFPPVDGPDQRPNARYLARLRERVQEMLGTLAPLERKVLRYLTSRSGTRGPTWGEVAQALRSSPWCVRNAYLRGLNKLSVIDPPSRRHKRYRLIGGRP